MGHFKRDIHTARAGTPKKVINSTSPLKKDPILGVIRNLILDFPQNEKRVQEDKSDPGYAQKKELQNFYANIGRFFEQFSPDQTRPSAI